MTTTRTRERWTYRGVDIYPAGANVSGVRWYAPLQRGITRMLRADTKAGMRELITHYRAAR